MPWPSVRIAGKKFPYIPVTLIFVIFSSTKKKSKKSLTEKETHEKI